MDDVKNDEIAQEAMTSTLTPSAGGGKKKDPKI